MLKSPKSTDTVKLILLVLIKKCIDWTQYAIEAIGQATHGRNLSKSISVCKLPLYQVWWICRFFISSYRLYWHLDWNTRYGMVCTTKVATDTSGLMIALLERVFIQVGGVAFTFRSWTEMGGLMPGRGMLFQHHWWWTSCLLLVAEFHI